MKKIFIITALLSFTIAGMAQNKENTQKRGWEIGVGANMINWSRVTAYGYANTMKGYSYNLDVKQFITGAEIYVAKELKPWLYIDLQAIANFDKHQNNLNSLYMGGLGLQFRATPLFKYKFVEPFVRISANYLYKNFRVPYHGKFQNDPTNYAHWKSTDTWNKDSNKKDKCCSVPIGIGVGFNAWMTECFGLGLLGEYMIPIQKQNPKFAVISAKLIWRFGKEVDLPVKTEVKEVYIEKEVLPIEKIVEKPVTVVKEVPVYKNLYNYLNNIHFDFDKATLRAESMEALDNIADILKNMPEKNFLIIGHTDVYGSIAYNKKLSYNRAESVYKALVNRGVNPNNLKFVGVGKQAALMNAGENDNVRLGDRKVNIEVIENMDYWNKIK